MIFKKIYKILCIRGVPGMKRHEGKTAIITGSARGLGRSMAERLASEGANVVITDIMTENAEKTASEISEQYGVEAVSYGCNVTDRDSVRQLMENVVEKFGKIDILINNAGVTRDASFMKMTEEAWDMVINTDLKGVFVCTQEAARFMRERKYGRVINIASMSGEMGNFGQANYSAAKAGVIGLTKTLAVELGHRNITANAIAPGLIDSEMTAKMPREAYQANIDAIPLGRAGKPEEVAALASFLASDDAAFINGACIDINGGMYR